MKRLVRYFFDMFFHTPTLFTLTLVALVMVGKLYEVDFDLNLAEAFIRMDSNQGDITLFWQSGCCRLVW